MLPRAYIVHQLRHRLRLRVPEMRSESEFFEQAREQIAGFEGVAAVEASDVTGSIVISHPDQTYENLHARLQAMDLFEFVSTPQPVTPAREILASGISRIDRFVSEGSLGRVDLGTLAFTALLGSALHQFIRGNYTGPAFPMILSGINLLRQSPQPPQDPDA